MLKIAGKPKFASLMTFLTFLDRPIPKVTISPLFFSSPYFESFSTRNTKTLFEIMSKELLKQTSFLFKLLEITYDLNLTIFLLHREKFLKIGFM